MNTKINKNKPTGRFKLFPRACAERSRSRKVRMGLTAVLFAASFTLAAQVGVNTETPATTLDVVGDAATATSLDGIIAPRLTGNQLRAKTYTAAQTGAMVYVTAADTAPAGQTANVTQTGYYQFDGTAWQVFSKGGAGKFVDGDTAANAVYTAGHVGIGTTSPGSKLTVIDGSSNTIADFRNSLAGGNGMFLAGGDSSSNYALAVGNKDNSNLFIVRGNGNVGIGTATPTVALDVAGDIKGIGSLELPANSGAISDEIGIRFGGVGSGISPWNHNPGGSGSYRSITFRTVGYSTLVSPASIVTRNAVTIGGNSGGLGIGTTTPDHPLHIASIRPGTGTISGSSTTITGVGTAFDTELAVGDQIIVKTSGTSIETVTVTSITSATEITVSPSFASDPAGSGFRYVDEDNGLIVGAVLGNVGIDTLSPTQDLHVNGSVRIEEALYDSNNQKGTAGQILSATATGTDWITPRTTTLVDADGDTKVEVEEGADDDTIRFDTAGTERMRIDSSGNVGIGGTATPASKLQVDGHITVTGGDVRFDDERSIYSYAGGTAGELRAGIYFEGTDKSVRVLTNSSEKMRVTENGNVGIGTTTPSALLDLGNTTFNAGTEKLAIGNSSNTYGPEIVSANRTYIHFTGKGAGSSFGVGIQGYQIDNPFLPNYFRAAPGLTNQPVSLFNVYADELTFHQDNNKNTGDEYTPTLRFRVNNTTAYFSGNVGIGTTAPSEKLSVYNGNIAVLNGANVTSLALGGTDYQWQLNRDWPDNGKFKIHYLQGNLDALTIERNGHVGIGTSTPANRLTVRRDATTAAENAHIVAENRSGATGQYALYGTTFENGAGSGFRPVAIGAVQTATTGRTADFIVAVADTDNADLSADEHMRITSGGNVGIGTATPAAKLDIASTDSGVLLPRIATIADITAPVDGMIAYAADEKCFKGYQDGAWADLTTCTVAGWSFTGVNAYNGQSVIDAQGIGYNGEAVPAASTIDVDVNVTTTGGYNASGTDATTGLTYSASGTFTSTGAQTITFTHNAPTIGATTHGTINMTLSGNATNTQAIAPRIDIKSIAASATTIVDVGIDTDNADGDNDPTTGTFEQTWMDRNLGARQAATALNDGLAYGNLYQWGRGNDGHELIVTNGDDPAVRAGSTTTATLATTPTPGHSDFIVDSNTTPFDWITPQDTSLWQGAAGTNNPCPSGYRLPTVAELTAMVTALSITNTATAASSALALPAPGRRDRTSGVVSFEASYGDYWSSTVNGTNSRFRIFLNTSTGTFNSGRASGLTVRCLKD